MHTEILSIGHELLIGTLVDTNCSYIANKCEMFGLEVIRHSCVGDNLKDIVEVMTEIGNRAGIAIVTGGLGPTLDDLTREAAAKANGVKLVLFPEALADIKNFFKRLGRDMPETNKRQAFFPEGAQYIPNQIGTAPGFSCFIGKTKFFFTPGVPNEMQLMFDGQIIPKIQQEFNILPLALKTKTISTFGMPEATVGEYLETLEKKFPLVAFGTRANFPEIQIKLYARGNKAKSSLTKAACLINKQLKGWIFSTASKKMEEVVADLLYKKKASVAIIENSHGNVDNLANVAKGIDFLSMGNVVNLRKISSLPSDMQESPIISTKKTTTQIAQKIAVSLKTTYGLVISSIVAKDSNTIYIALNDKEAVTCYSCHISFAKKEHERVFAVMLALDLLRRKILNIPPLAEVFGNVLKSASNPF